MDKDARKVTVKTISSLEKILPNAEPTSVEKSSLVMWGETLNFQLAIFTDKFFRERIIVDVESELKDYINVSQEMGVVASYVPEDRDDYYLTDTCSVIPDVLLPLDEAQIVLPYKQWKTLWFSVSVPKGVKSGDYPVKITLKNENGDVSGVSTYIVQVMGVTLPKDDLILTNWMHYDCISNAHGVELFTNKFYRIFKEYLKVYIESGFNTLLTPLFTPPLDTAIGKERKTAQLVKVFHDENGYRFDFGELKKFIRFIMKMGVRRIEFSHLFTQWGGKFCPKIIVNENGKEIKDFGWDDSATGERYVKFLNIFLPQLANVIDELKIRDKCVFHLTDEPMKEHLEQYEKCRNLVRKHLGDISTMDAMGDYAYYENGLVDIPVVAIEHYKSFEEKGVENLMVYNCCLPTNGYYPNRFINMPSQRLRVLGFQMYKANTKGYLHWGFNFYNSMLSYTAVNPYLMNDCNGAFPSGDGFVVYPTKDGVIKSLRLEIIKESFQDYRVLKLLERYVGRDSVLKLLKEVHGYNEYPKSATWHAEIRTKINLQILKCIKEKKDEDDKR